ncbi:MAG TPA: hypothetical protein VMV52_00635 [Candidatus Nanopelagicaceae bacterium]|nr:hypothetical protein [Candidatus Nanopelagicaceae bacterium]
MNSIKQLRLLYGLPLALAIGALILSLNNSRPLYATLALVLFIGAFVTLQFFSSKVKHAFDESLSRTAESATLAGALFSTLWTTFGAVLLITIKRH